VGVTYVLEVYEYDRVLDRLTGDSRTRSFKSERGAIAAGFRELRKAHRREFYGYQAANRYEGESPYRRHVVAEWKDRGRLLAKVWR